jgi:hypothetical protein
VINYKRWGGQSCGTYAKEINANRNLMEKPENYGPLGRPRHIFEDKVEMDLKEKAWRLWTELICYR